MLTSDLENREKQQEKMLDQLKEIQNSYKACENGRRQTELQSAELAQQVEESTKEAERYLTEFKHSEALRLEIEKKREDLKMRAQETIRQWKLKCKKLDREIEKQNQTISELMDKSSQVRLVDFFGTLSLCFKNEEKEFIYANHDLRCFPS